MPNKPIVISETSKTLFFARLKRKGKCLEWQGRRMKKGYGRFGFRQYPAHRVAYFLATGIDPGDRLVCHECDNPPCCDPDHLWLGDNLDNVRDRDRKGRTARQKGARHGCAVVTEAQVRAIRRSKQPSTVLAKRYGITYTSICRIRRGERWSHI